MLPIRTHFDWEAFIVEKLRRWTDDIEATALMRIALSRIPLWRKHLPPCVLFVWLELLCNAWPTAARFQQEGACLIHSDCGGLDSVEHYSGCTYLWQAMGKCVPIQAETSGIFFFLGLDGSTEQESILILLGAFATKRLTDDLRRQGHPYCGHRLEAMVQRWFNVAMKFCRS